MATALQQKRISKKLLNKHNEGLVYYGRAPSIDGNNSLAVNDLLKCLELEEDFARVL